MDTIPIVDLGKVEVTENFATDPEWISAAEQIRDGLGAVGFLYLTNHGIPDTVISDAFRLSEKLFKLPDDVKQRFKKDTQSEGNVLDIDKYFGYTAPGGERLHPTVTYEVKEIFDWLDNGRGVYPTEQLPEFDKTMLELDRHCKETLKKLLRLLAMGLKLEDVEVFVNACRHFKEPDKHKGLYNVRMLHYPPIPDDLPANPGTVRCGEHSDYGFLTLLFQDDVGGLEVKTVDGQWVHAKPIPGSILINTGDLTEFWSCGIYPATPHRITIPDVSDSRRRQSRYSVVFFNGPDCDTVVTPIDMKKKPCETKRLAKNGKHYSKEPVVAYDYMCGRLADQYS